MIQFTERGAVRQGRRPIRVLAQAAVAAGRAPSILNSQPWRWRIADDVAELRADRQRQLTTVDPDGRLLTVSCGAALHHARTALAGARVVADVTRLPDPTDPDLLARIRVVGDTAPDPAAVRLQLAMALRRTDRRPFADVEVPPAALGRLRDAAEGEGAHLHLLHADDVVTLAVAAARASEAEFADPWFRAELSAWTGREDDAEDGIPASASAGWARRPVPLRDLDPGAQVDRTTDAPVDGYARYAVLFTDGDTPADWLAAGEALSAVLLTATVERLAASPISDVIEVPATRMLVRSLLGGVGHPLVALRLGVPDGGAAAATGRRPADAVIEMPVVDARTTGQA